VERVREASNGRLEITIYSEGEVVPRNDATVAVKDRVLDIATIATAMDMGRLGPVTYILSSSGLPAGPSTTDWLAWIFEGGGLDKMNEVYKDWCVVKGAASGAGELFCHSNKPLATAADFKGLKFRTMGMWAEILKDYGAAVTTVAGAELYASVQRGVLDAFEFGPPSTNWPYGFHEVCKYIGLPGIQSPGYTKPVLINKAFWAELPADLQAILEHESTVLALDSYCKVLYEDSKAMEKYKAYGTQFFTVDEDFQKDIAQKSRALCEKYATEDATFADVWEHQKAFFKVWRSSTGITPKYTIFD